MRLVLVGFPSSIHLVKYVGMLAGADADIHVVPSAERPWTEGWRGATLHHTSAIHAPPAGDAGCTVVDHRARLGGGTARQAERAAFLADLVEVLRPDVVHAQELQHGAYQVLEARRSGRRGAAGGERWPPWVVSNWGSDVSWYGRDPRHRHLIRQVLAECQAYWCECHRDVGLAWAEGFRGEVLPVVPIAGGYDVERAVGLRQPGPTSSRTAIAVKGYQHAVGRALVALEALARCADLLPGREICLHSASDGVEERFASLAQQVGARLTVLRGAPYDDVLRMHGRARTSVGSSLSDGISTSFLEALLGGSFPVQSRTACAGEWALDGHGALLVDPEDVAGVAAATRRALCDDALVDAATALNDRTVRRHLDMGVVRGTVLDAYARVLADAGDGRLGARARGEVVA